MYHYKTQGTCSTGIDLEISPDGIITYCKIINGCKGNTEGLSRMVIGRKADEVAETLAGIPCRSNTSCPDQLSKAIRACQAG
ncbi:MAG: TIGR03905 family TSCPD domain-containing protein [Clostridia bacterium]|nr:TIGR03905 family TSCPD domain-containing protein [Clostridia bacterium]